MHEHIHTYIHAYMYKCIQTRINTLIHAYAQLAHVYILDTYNRLA